MDTGKPTIDSLFGKITELERRLRTLEGANRLLGPIPQGQSIEVLDPADGSLLARIGDTTYGVGAEFMDDSGVVVARFGTTSGGVPGVEIGDAPGSTQPYMAITQDGQLWPYITHPWRYFVGAFAVPVTSGSFTDVFECGVELITYPEVKIRLLVGVDGGSTGEVRVANAGASQVTSAVTCAGGSFTNIEFNWDISSWTDVNTGPVSFYVQARRTAGAGNVNVYMPTELAMGFVDGTATGL